MHRNNDEESVVLSVRQQLSLNSPNKISFSPVNYWSAVPTSNRNSKKKTVTSSGLSQTRGFSNEVHRAVQSELKKYIEPKVTYMTFGAQVSANGTIVSLTQNLTQGDTAINNYTGYRIKPTSLKIRMSVSSDQTFSTVRMIVFRWLDSVFPLPTGIVVNTGTGFSAHSPLSWVNNTKIQVLADEFIALKPRAASGYDNVCRTINCNLGRGPCIMLPTGSSGATPQMNGLYVLCITDDLIPSQPAFVWYSELIYTDA